MADWNVEILGTDISEKVLMAAQAGQYPPYALRTVQPLVLSRYFRDLGNGAHQIDSAISRMVRFELLNLKETVSARRFGTWDVIFCRNVMIYFDDAMRTRCVRMFHEQLAADGTLFIGHSENLRSLDVPFAPMPQPHAFAYTKSPANRSLRHVA
jgi:chemotaxis protein methyltransferase CheR